MVTNSLEPRDDIRSLIARVRRRWVGQVRLRAAGVALAAGAVPLVAGGACWQAPNARRAVARGGDVAARWPRTAVVASVCMWRFRRRPANRQVARFIEERVSCDQPATRRWMTSSSARLNVAESG